MTYGERLKILRQAADIPQSRLAKRLGMTAPKLCDIENGNREFSRSELREAAAVVRSIINERKSAVADAFRLIREAA